jgi:hypothetical protein
MPKSNIFKQAVPAPRKRITKTTTNQMSTGSKLSAKTGCYYVTFQVVGWIDMENVLIIFSQKGAACQDRTTKAQPSPNIFVQH